MKRLFRFAWPLALVLVLLAWGLWQALPGLLESRVIPAAARNAGIEDLSCPIRRIGLFGADAGPIVLGAPENPALTIASLQADFTPWGLAYGQIKGIRIAGVQVYGAVDENGFSLQGFSLPPSKQVANPEPSPGLSLPVAVHNLKVESASLTCQWQGRTYRIPMALDASLTGPGQYQCALSLYPRGQKIALNADVDLAAPSVSATLETRRLDLGRFGDLTAHAPGLNISGGLDAFAKGGWKNNAPAPASARVLFTGDGVFSGATRLASPSGKPLRIDLSFENPVLAVTLHDVQLTEPVGLALPEVQASLTLEKGGISARGGLGYRLTSLPLGDMTLGAPIQGRADFSGNLKDDGYWDFSLKNLPDSKGFGLKGPGLAVTAQQPRFEVQGKSSARETVHVNFSASLPVIKTNAGKASVEAPLLAISGTMDMKPGRKPVLDARAAFKDAKVHGSDPRFEVTGLEGALPFSWPEQTAKGRVSAKNIRLEDKNLGPVSVDIARKDLGVEFSGAHQNLLVPGLNVEFKGQCGLDGAGDFFARTNFSVPEYKAFGLDLGRFSPGAKGMSFDGVLQVTGEASMDKTGLKTGVDIHLAQGALNAPDKDLSITGMGLSFRIEDLLTLRSPPRQTFTFEKARMGTIEASDGKVEFVMENPASFFIERSSFAWCGGHVYSPAVLIQTGASDYSLSLYCDRLDFAGVLKQLGGLDAQGNGSLNGIIPVRIQNGQVSFDNGHLYSTPGDTGVVKLKGADMLTAGMAPGTPQYTQLELARMALEEYHYQWAKLVVNSEGETLSLKLQLDGKPGKALPFIPDSKTGGFVKVDDKHPGATFEGIKLNLNFKLPFNLFMQYGMKLKDYL